MSAVASAGAAGLIVAALLAVAVVLTFGDHAGIRRKLTRRLLPWPGGAGRDRGGVAAGQPPDRASAGPPDAGGLHDVAMILDLIGAMLDAGAGIGRALELIATLASPELAGPLRPVVSALAIGADWDTAWRSSGTRSPQLHALRDALSFAALTGAPSSALLYARAARLRRERFRTAERRAAALGVKLVIPLGLCSLPAFVCLGIVPVLLALLPV